MGTIEGNITSALSDADAKAFAATQLETWRAGSSESEALVVRMGRDMLVLAITFALISVSVITNVTVLGFQFTDISLVLKTLPAVVAILYYRMVTQVIRTDALLSAYSQLVRVLHPQFYKSDLELLSFPPTFAPEHLIGQHAQGISYRLFRIAAAPIGFVFMLAPLLFECYAYWRCFSRFGTGDVPVWVSLAFSVTVLLQTAAYWLAARDLSES